ncbi:hypothetical protein [Dactylosporangium sp. NPDC051484]|uniref:hypothetical protein n=1 Tax=Dactylosporangium sp. NPDC051484 TaxID=3154942 RepID=UPI00344CE1BA
MTLAIDRNALQHFDVLPDLRSETCLIHQCEGSCPVDVITVDGELRHVWWCTCCSSQYTTSYVPIVCPDGVPWCVSHGQHPPQQHRAAGAYTAAEVDMRLDPATVLVDSRLASTVGAEPLVWVAAACWSEWDRFGEGVGMTAACAREVGLRLIQLANNIEGGEPR